MNHYLILPSLKEPKYIIPTDSTKLFSKSLSLYTPFTLKKKFLIRILKLLRSTNILKQLLTKNIINERKLMEYIPNIEKYLVWIYKSFSSNRLKCAYLINSTPNAKKITVQVMDEQSNIIGYTKIADSEIGKQRIREERNNLILLSELDLKQTEVPKIISFEDMEDIAFLSISTPMNTINNKNTSITMRHIDVLIELFNKTSTEQFITESDSYNKVNERMVFIPEDERNIYDKGMHRFIEEIAGGKIPLGLCHYDFKPWNIKFNLQTNRLFVYDWEFAKIHWLPLWDIFHFILQPAILVKRMQAANLAKMLFSENPLISEYMNAVALPPDIFKSLLIFYLCDVSSFYYEKIFKYNEIDEELSQYLKVIKQLLSYLL